MKPGCMIFQNQEDYDAVDVSGIDPGLKVYFFVDLSSISEGYLFYLLAFSWNVLEGFPGHSFEFFFIFFSRGIFKCHFHQQILRGAIN